VVDGPQIQVVGFDDGRVARGNHALGRPQIRT
jgi:hypothetical protein